MVSCEGSSMDPTKVDAIHSWPRSTSVTKIQNFIELAGYYRWFVEIFSTIASLLTLLTHQDILFVWSNECDANF